MSATMEYLDQFLEPMAEAFTPEMAQTIVGLRAAPALQARVDQLATKATEGSLTADEDQEYKSYIEAADILGIIQAKAMRFLSRCSDYGA